MDEKGLDIAITTIILIILGVAVLIGAILFVRNGFSFLEGGTKPLLTAQNLEAARNACELICRSENELAFCCEGIEMAGEKVFCYEESLNVDCNINCAAVSCPI